MRCCRGDRGRRGSCRRAPHEAGGSPSARCHHPSAPGSHEDEGRMRDEAAGVLVDEPHDLATARSWGWPTTARSSSAWSRYAEARRRLSSRHAPGVAGHLVYFSATRSGSARNAHAPLSAAQSRAWSYLGGALTQTIRRSLLRVGCAMGQTNCVLGPDVWRYRPRCVVDVRTRRDSWSTPRPQARQRLASMRLSFRPGAATVGAWSHAPTRRADPRPLGTSRRALRRTREARTPSGRPARPPRRRAGGCEY